MELTKSPHRARQLLGPNEVMPMKVLSAGMGLRLSDIIPGGRKSALPHPEAVLGGCTRDDGEEGTHQSLS